MTKIEINGHITHIPAGWNELEPNQIIDICNMLQEPMEEHEFRVKLLLRLTGWHLVRTSDTFNYMYAVKIGKKTHNLVDWQFVEISKKMDYLFSAIETSGKRVMHINSRLSLQKFPIIRYRWHRLYGPADKLFNLTFGEYLTADNFFDRWVKTGEHHFLNKLTATLYRKKDPNYRPDHHTNRGDIREPFNAYTVERREKLVKKLPTAIKNATALYWNGCKHHLAATFDNVFSGTGKQSKFGSLELVDVLADGDVTKSQTVRNQFLYDVMVHLDSAARQYKELKKKAVKT